MKIELNALEARLIGCLLEKQITTPDQYPLSLNSLTLACNQKNNRDPVLDLREGEVQDAVDALLKKYLVSDRSAGYGGRVTKYQHRFCNTEFGSLKFSAQELGILCVLLLRGPQTSGELRTRTNRLCEFADVAQVEAVLETLLHREDGPYVARLPRQPGARESRFAHLFGGELPLESAVRAGTDEDAGPQRPEGLGPRVERLEQLVEELRAEMDSLRAASTPR
ncbi:MAG TPA: DUF480 domain-containing protein [Steroidobacteraceae bacterium]|nr:DUF480 domain-containing protein [Steroidobacteraceae bacterium]